MPATMNFAGLSKFNVVTNSLSGNFYPMTEERQSYGFCVTVYMLLVFLVKLVFVVTALHAWVNYVPILRALEDGGSSIINVSELTIISVYLNLRRGQLRNLIREFNVILIDSGDLRRCVNDSVGPQQKSMKIYLFCSCGAVVFWGSVPLLKIINQDRFSYDDFILPAYLPGEPFSVTVFICGVLMQTAAGIYLVFQKISIDTYISTFIATLTAEYSYIRQQIAFALRRDNNDEIDETNVEAALHKCVRHHCAVMRTGQMLIELFGLYVGVMYINSILRFCACGFSFIAFRDDYVRKSIYFAYAVGILIQVYVMCSCVQALLEASTSITDDAFHENWHGHSRAIKNIFSTIELSNHMECRLTAFRIIDLTVPTLASILNRAYTATLLLQKMY